MMAAASAGSSERDIEDRQRAPYLQQDGRMVYDEYEDLLRFDGEARKDAGYEDNKKRLQRDGQKAFRVIAGLGNEKTQEEEFDRMLNERHECDIYEMNTLVAILRLAEEYGKIIIVLSITKNLLSTKGFKK
ncbi:MAG: hypothetical protein H6925_05260 [Holosporaceae bacterium]|nr:MAG: hypothetical protein H6925_05260 [Holosporaceae bacterium]